MSYEEMTGVERRRRWSDEEKLPILGAVGIDREIVASVARRHDIICQYIYEWRTELRRKGLMRPRNPTLVPVEVTGDVVSDTGNYQSLSVDHVEQVHKGRSLRARAKLSDAQWIRLIRIAAAA